MDGFTAFCGWTVFIALVAGSVGSLHGRYEVGGECTKTGVSTINKMVYECKPVAAIVNGQHIPLVQPNGNDTATTVR